MRKQKRSPLAEKKDVSTISISEERRDDELPTTKPVKSEGEATSAGSLEEVFLRILLPSVPRQGKPGYLPRVLDSFEEQMTYAQHEDALAPSVRVSVFHLRPGSKHSDFEEAKAKHNSPYFEFVPLEPDTTDVQPGKDHVYKPGLTPDAQARQQTRDIVKMMQTVKKSCRYILLNEDDFKFCPASVFTSLYLIQKVSRGEDFNSIRISYGMNGIIMPCKDIDGFSDYLLSQQVMMPVDLLADEWLSVWHPMAKKHFGPRRRSFFYQHNLLEHLGDVSSFEGRTKRPSWPCGKHNKLINSFVPGTEYSSSCNGRSDVSPCDLPRPGPIVTIH
eukprot:CAMPEP_0113910958 /NCGR_PEP_ID=MMETSP0780_2-20120614/27873_1 /TAXON_ID=652834 /ORGANISM="Palpitomonas bilix" /LENGTH=330 /DNA_ID=CAMNT_0000907289 /DNA_START=397 /DNA_END=1389 /DNA_ORIENTATION=+ /assembly_acc=CAM_ASM_000599